MACVSIIAPGAYLGILVDAKFFKGSHRTLNDTSACKSIFRFSFTIILLFPSMLLAWSEFQTSSVIVQMLFFFVLPGFLASFLYFAFSRLLFKKIGLVTSDSDVIEVQEGRIYVSGDEDDDDSMSNNGLDFDQSNHN